MSKPATKSKKVLVKHPDVIPPDKLPELTNENVLLLSLKGYSNRQIGDMYGITREAIGQRLLRLGVNKTEFKQSIVKGFMSKRAETLAFKQMLALEGITPDKIKDASAYHNALTAAILYDKERLERGESTDIVTIANINMSLDEIRAKKAALQEQIIDVEVEDGAGEHEHTERVSQGGS